MSGIVEIFLNYLFDYLFDYLFNYLFNYFFIFFACCRFIDFERFENNLTFLPVHCLLLTFQVRLTTRACRRWPVAKNWLSCVWLRLDEWKRHVVEAV